jgi:hypothetical protein
MEMWVICITPIRKLSARAAKTIPTPKKPRRNNFRKKEPIKQTAPMEKIVLGSR